MEYTYNKFTNEFKFILALRSYIIDWIQIVYNEPRCKHFFQHNEKHFNNWFRHVTRTENTINDNLHTILDLKTMQFYNCEERFKYLTQFLVDTVDVSSKLRKQLAKIDYSIVRTTGVAKKKINYSKCETYLIATDIELQILECLKADRTLPSDFWLRVYKRLYTRDYTAKKDLVEFLQPENLKIQAESKVQATSSTDTRVQGGESSRNVATRSSVGSLPFSSPPAQKPALQELGLQSASPKLTLIHRARTYRKYLDGKELPLNSPFSDFSHENFQQPKSLPGECDPEIEAAGRQSESGSQSSQSQIVEDPTSVISRPESEKQPRIQRFLPKNRKSMFFREMKLSGGVYYKGKIRDHEISFGPEIQLAPWDKSSLKMMIHIDPWVSRTATKMNEKLFQKMAFYIKVSYQQVFTKATINATKNLGMEFGYKNISVGTNTLNLSPKPYVNIEKNVFNRVRAGCVLTEKNVQNLYIEKKSKATTENVQNFYIEKQSTATRGEAERNIEIPSSVYYGRNRSSYSINSSTVFAVSLFTVIALLARLKNKFWK